MMQAFDALFGGQRAGSARGTTSGASRDSNAQDEANASGGFDRMLQSQASRAANSASRTADTMGAGAQAKTKETGPRDAEPARASDETKSAEAKANDDARETSRAQSRRDAPNGSDAATDDDEPASAASGEETTNSDTAAPASPNDTATPALPEQMLALLNGLAGAPAATPAQATQALPPGLLRGDAVATAADPRGGAATAPVLPMPAGAQAAATAPEGDATATAAFAMAMGAAAAADAKPEAPDAGLDTTTTGDTTPTSLPSISTASNHPLSRTAAAAVANNAPLVLDNDFENGFSSRIAWMADQKVGHAEIRVTPDHLGAIDVRLQLDGNRVNAEFHSAQPDVRHALESSLPRLRDMLGQQGLQLGQADVGQRQTGQRAGSNGQAATFAGGSDRSGTANDAGWTRGPAVRASRGLLDEYA